MKIILLDTNIHVIDAWKIALSKVKCPIEIKLHHGTFDETLSGLVNPGKTAIASPGNSLGLLGGGFDKGLANLLMAQGDSSYKSVEQYLRKNIAETQSGYIPPGQTIRINFETYARFHTSKAWSLYQANTLLYTPTMRSPGKLVYGSDSRVLHDKIALIFDCIWQTLVSFTQANCENLILPGFGTGYGGLPLEMAAEGMVKAIDFFFSTQKDLCAMYRFLHADAGFMHE